MLKSLKEIRGYDDSMAIIINAAITFSKAITKTLGPCGCYVLIKDKNRGLIATKDGVSVANTIRSRDPLEQMAISIIRQAAQETVKNAGDGTTTSIVLATSILTYGYKLVLSGTHPMALKNGLQKCLNHIVEFLLKNTKEIANKEALLSIATISANNDENLGALVADAVAFHQESMSGITVAENKSGKSYLEKVDGMQLSSGYMSPWFVSDRAKKESVLVNPSILLYNGSLTDSKDVAPILDFIMQTGKGDGILFIAKNIRGNALTTLVLNKVKGGMPICAIKAQNFGMKTDELLEDIAVVSGATIIDPAKGMSIESFQNCLGKASRIVVGSSRTSIIDAKGSADKIAAHISLLKSIEKETHDKSIQKRISLLAGGICIMHIGAITEAEMREKKDRVDDALHATFAAIKYGVLPGGGNALLYAANSLDEIEDQLNGDELFAIAALKFAMKMPINSILTNATQSPEIIVNKILESKNIENGYDALHNKFVNLFDAKIMDPTMVLITALTHAISAAGTLLTTAASIVSKKTTAKNDAE